MCVSYIGQRNEGASTVFQDPKRATRDLPWHMINETYVIRQEDRTCCIVVQQVSDKHLLKEK